MDIGSRHLRTLVGMLLAAGLGATTASAQDAVTTNAVNMRSGPGTQFARITTLPAGAPVDIASCTGSWCRVIYRGQSGYVSRSFLDEDGVVVTAPPPVYVEPRIYVEPPYLFGGPGYYYGPVRPGWRPPYRPGRPGFRPPTRPGRPDWRPPGRPRPGWGGGGPRPGWSTGGAGRPGMVSPRPGPRPGMSGGGGGLRPGMGGGRPGGPGRPGRS